MASCSAHARVKAQAGAQSITWSTRTTHESALNDDVNQQRLRAVETPVEVRAVLADGSVARVRPLDAGDLEELRRLHREMPERDRYFRFFTLHLSPAIEKFLCTLVSGPDAHMLALGAFVDGRLIGVGDFVVLATVEQAEVAFVVEHALHTRGVATLLLEHLVSAARRRGIRRFVAEVSGENTAMLRVFADSGLPHTTRRDGPTVHVEMDLDLDEGYYARVSDRERVADVASLRHLLRPASVVVVGASRRAGSVGHAVLRNVLAGGYTGTVYAINPHAEQIEEVPAFHTVAGLPEPPDLAVVCVPAASVPEVAEECGRRGTRALLVIAAGISDEPELANGLLAAVRTWGMRLVGPNCIGLVNSDPDVWLDATFTAAGIPTGSVGVVTQSGGVGIALLEGLAGLGLGVSTVVSTGDKYDVSGNDLLLWWQRDERTRVGVLYLESFGNPRKFAWLARRLAAHKPLVVLNAGASPAAQRAAASHTAATATPAITREALLRQAGVISVDGLDELHSVVGVLTWQPLPSGNRVAVVSNAGGLGVLAADACARHGLDLAELSASTRSAIAEVTPPQASVHNPVDITAGIDIHTFGRVLELVISDPGIDAVLVPVVDTAITDPTSTIAPAVARPQQSGVTKPVVVVRVGSSVPVTALNADEGKVCIPCFNDPALAARALAHITTYAQWRAQPRGSVPDLPRIDIAAARAQITTELHDQPADGWLEPEAVQRLLACFGLPAVPTRVCTDEEHAVVAFRELGAPVAVKASATGLLHKTKAGGIALGVTAEEQVRTAWSTMRDRFGEALRGVLVQPMVAPGREFLVGIWSEPVFGPLVVFGLGGVDTDIVADRTHRLVPLTDRDASEMLGSLRAAPRLFGEFAEQRLDRDGLVDVLLRVARMAELLPEIAEVDLNPVIVTDHGVTIPDARIRIQQREPTDPLARRLRA